MLQSPAVSGLDAQHDHVPLVQPTVLAATTGSARRGVPKFNRRKAIGIGTTLIVAAVLGILINFIDVAFDIQYWRVESARRSFWVGVVVSIRQQYCMPTLRFKIKLKLRIMITHVYRWIDRGETNSY
jgi:hypothetical protein